MKKIISTTEAPAAIGPYSQAVRAGSLVFCAGQVPLDPKSGQIVSEDITEQTRRVLDNVMAILKAEGLTMANVVKTTVFLADDDAAEGGGDDRVALHRPQFVSQPSANVGGNVRVLKEKGALEKLPAPETRTENEVAVEQRPRLPKEREQVLAHYPDVSLAVLPPPLLLPPS